MSRQNTDSAAQACKALSERYHAELVARRRRNRDAEIIHLYFAGYSDKAIAKRVGLAVRTVSSIRRREKDLIDAIRRQSLGLDATVDRQS